MKDNNDFNKNIGEETEKVELQNENTEKLIKDDIINEESNELDKTVDEGNLNNGQIEDTSEKNELIYDPEVEKKYTESKTSGSEREGKKRKRKMNDNIKNNYQEKSFMTSITAVIVMLIMAFGIVSSYTSIKTVVQKDVIESPYQNYELLQGIYETSYVLNKDVIDLENGEDKQWDEIYLNPESKDIDGYHQIRNGLYKELNHFQMNLQNNFKNLDYSILDSAGNSIIANKNNNLADLINKNDEESIKSLQDYYGFYMVVRYDNDGYANVEKVYGADDYRVRNIFSEFTFGHYYHNEYGNIESTSAATAEVIEINLIKNTTFIYGIPEDLTYTDKIYNIVNNQRNSINIDKLVMIVLLILIGILIIGLLVPYRYGRKAIGVSLIKRIPLEINIAIFVTLAWICGMGAFALTILTIEGAFWDELSSVFGITIALDSKAVYLFNAIAWTLIMYIIFLGDMLLKYIFTTGLLKYLKENSILIKCLRLVKRTLRKIAHGIHKVYNYVAGIDLSEKSNKSLIKILGANLLVMIGCCLFWMFGIFIAAAYTILVFYFTRKHYEKIKNNFQTLLEASNQMSDGNLDVKIEEDLGMFNPLKDSLQEIQSGFKKAVNEEVKSQRMKTELISNVSHDLKTPLTSIITYVDLLKNENITEEERKSYIDTLDKKSQRLKFLIEDLFEVSKATSGNIQLHLVNVDIVELVRQIQIELDDKLKKSDLIIKNNFPENKVILELDSQKTFRIFENLLNNVSKYAMTGSRVYVDIEDNDSDVKITIKNISAVEIDFTPDEIIERFQRGDKSRNTEGSGLGLAIAKSFVEIQGGSFSVETDGDLFKVIIVFKK